VLNNPLSNTDPDGEFIVPILMGAAMGAIMGGATYSVGIAASGGSWNSGDFWGAVGFGAVGGAISGGFSALAPSLGAFGNTLGYNMLSQTSSNIMTSAIFGNQITAGDLAGSVAAGLVGSKLPGFRGVSGGAFKNGIAELGHSTIRGAYLGYIQGSIAGMIDNEPDKAMQGMIGGAISGGLGAITRIGIMGAYRCLDSDISTENHGQINRNGGLLKILMSEGSGVTIGNNVVVQDDKDRDYLNYVHNHEVGHIVDINKMGYARFYGQTLNLYIKSVIKSGFTSWMMHAYGYNPNRPLTLENRADLYAFKRLGYYYNIFQKRNTSFP